MADTKNIKAALQQELDRLVEARDDLRVQLKLAKADLADEWSRLEVKWERVQEEIGRIGVDVKQPVTDIGVAARQLLDDLKAGYDRIRAQLKA